MPDTGSRTAKFFTNVLWSWSGVAVNLLTAFFLSPFLIRRLGDDNFGIWALVLAMVEYYWLLDLGFRNATVKYTAHYRALGEPAEVNRVVNTALAYSLVVAALTLCMTVLARANIVKLFHSDKPIFNALLLIVGVSWSIGMIFNVFTAALEGFHRFDVTSRVWIIATALRSTFTFVLILMGYGLLQMAWVLLASQCLVYACSFLLFRRAFPELVISPGLANRRTFKEMAAFGSHNLAILISFRVLVQGPALLIGAKLAPRYVAYFSVPQKLLDYPADAVGRVGSVSGANAAELYARGEWSSIARLGIWTNRYCAALYFFLVIYLAVYGKPFLTVWLTPEFADRSAALLPILMIGAAASSSQYNSATILMHVGSQKWYSLLMVVEAGFFLVLVPFALARFGLVGAAVVISTLAVLSRGVGVSWMLARKLRVPYVSFLLQIYAVPLSISGVVLISLRVLRGWLPGTSWLQLALAGAISGCLYGLLSFRFALSAEHKTAVLRQIQTVGGRLYPFR